MSMVNIVMRSQGTRSLVWRGLKYGIIVVFTVLLINGVLEATEMKKHSMKVPKKYAKPMMVDIYVKDPPENRHFLVLLRKAFPNGQFHGERLPDYVQLDNHRFEKKTVAIAAKFIFYLYDATSISTELIDVEGQIKAFKQSADNILFAFDYLYTQYLHDTKNLHSAIVLILGLTILTTTDDHVHNTLYACDSCFRCIDRKLRSILANTMKDFLLKHTEARYKELDNDYLKATQNTLIQDREFYYLFRQIFGEAVFRYPRYMTESQVSKFFNAIRMFAIVSIACRNDAQWTEYYFESLGVMKEEADMVQP